VVLDQVRVVQAVEAALAQDQSAFVAQGV